MITHDQVRAAFERLAAKVALLLDTVDEPVRRELAVLLAGAASGVGRLRTLPPGTPLASERDAWLVEGMDSSVRALARRHGVASPADLIVAARPLAAAALLGRFATRLPPLERQTLRILLHAALEGLCPDGRPPVVWPESGAWKTAVAVLGHEPSSPLFSGRLSFLRPSVVALLAEEAEQKRADRLRLPTQFVAPGGKRAAALHHHGPALLLLSKIAGRDLKPANDGRDYVYYERDGDWLPPHCDREEFDLVLLVMLAQECSGLDGQTPEGGLSTFVVYPPGGGLVRYAMRPGEGTLFRGGHTVHGRLPIAPGERTVLLTLAYVDAVGGRRL